MTASRLVRCGCSREFFVHGERIASVVCPSCLQLVSLDGSGEPWTPLPALRDGPEMIADRQRAEIEPWFRKKGRMAR